VTDEFELKRNNDTSSAMIMKAITGKDKIENICASATFMISDYKPTQIKALSTEEN
jgi:hypothetical protein